MGCSPSTHLVGPNPGKMMATYQLRPTFQYCERLLVYSDDVTSLGKDIPPPSPPPTKKKDIFDLKKFEDIDRKATMAPEALLRQPYTKLVQFLLEGLKDTLSKVRAIFRWVTAQPLDKMNIQQEPDYTLPLHQLWRIQQGKGNYAQLVLTLCRLAGIPCVIINGLMKGSTYSIGQTVKGDSLYGEWNAVLIDGNWRFIDAYWGACAVGGEDKPESNPERLWIKRKRGVTHTTSVYKCDENYFLTDPEHLSASHFPFIEKWQLLEKPITLKHFEEMAFLKDRFFNLNMGLITHDKCIVRSLNGEVDFRFSIPVEDSVNLKFRHIFSRHQTSVPSVGGALTRQNRYVFVHKIQPDILSVEVRVPVAGIYRLELVGKDATINTQGYDFDWVVLYKIHIDKGLSLCREFPPVSATGWGPGYEAHCLGLSPSTHKTGRIKTTSGEVEIRFQISSHNSNSLQFSHRLSAVETEESALCDRAVHWLENDEVVFFVRTPTKGEYAFQLYSSDPNGTTNKENFCNYFITSEQNTVHFAFPRDFGDGAGRREGLSTMGVRLVSHNAPVIHCHKDELDIVFELEKPVELFAALSGVGLRAADSKRLVNQHTRKNFVYFKIRMPAFGCYGFKVLGMDPTAAKTFRNIYDYLIEFRSRKLTKKPETRLKRRNSQLTVISEMNEDRGLVVVSQPPIREQVKCEPEAKNATNAGPKDNIHMLNLDPRVGRIQLKIKQCIAEKKDELLEQAIENLRQLGYTYTEPEIALAQVELNTMRSQREVQRACKSRNTAELQTAIENIKSRRLEGPLRKEMLRAQRHLDREINIRKNLHNPMSLDYRAVAEIKAYMCPPSSVKKVMMATFLLLGHFEEEIEDWGNVCSLLSRVGKDSLKKRMDALSPADVSVDVALGAKDFLQDLTVDKVLCVSSGAAAFFIWTQGIIKGVEERYGDRIPRVTPRKRRFQIPNTPLGR